MTAIEKAAAYVVEIARREVGYREKASNSQLDDKTANAGSSNYTKYAAYFDRLWNSGIKWYNTRKQGGDWCDMFFDWAQCQAWGWEVARKVLYQPMESCGAGCEFSARYYKDNSAWTSRNGTPKIGDQIFFGPVGEETHTGMVVGVDANNVYTIEGNSGNRCAERTYARSAGNIAGYGRPNYALVAYKFVDDETPIQDDEKEINMEEIKKLIAARKTTRDEIMEATGDQWIGKFTDLPPWAKKEVRELIEMGAIKGTKLGETVEETEINASLNTYIRPCIVALRVAKKVMSDVPKDALADQMERVVEFLRGETE